MTSESLAEEDVNMLVVFVAWTWHAMTNHVLTLSSQTRPDASSSLVGHPSTLIDIPILISSTIAMADATIKGLPPPPKSFDGSDKRILIVHARWNAVVIESLVQGCVAKLRAQGVKESRIHIETVPGSFELPFACQQ